MLKKMLIVAVVLILVLCLICCGTGIYVTYVFNQWASSWTESVEELEALGNDYSFSPPQDGVVPEDRMEAYFTVRDKTSEFIFSNATVQKIQQAQGGPAPNIGFWELWSLIFGFPQEMIGEFASELDSQQMSPEEYFYITRQVYATIDEGALIGDEELTSIFNQLKEANDSVAQMVQQQGNNPEAVIDFENVVEGLSAGGVSEGMMETVKQHSDALTEQPLMSYFELLFIRAVQQGQIQGVDVPAEAESFDGPVENTVPQQ